MSKENYFKRLEPEKIGRISVDCWGKEKKGKTSFALGFPPPIAFFNFDFGLREIVHKFPKIELYVVDFLPTNPELTVEHATDLLNTFMGALDVAISDNSFNTVVIDTGTRLWQIIQKVKLDKIKKSREKKGTVIYPFDYADANEYFANIVSMIVNSDKYLVITHRARQKYNERGQPTGNYESQENSQMAYLVSMKVMLDDVLEEGDTKNVLTHFGIIESSRLNPDDVGRKIKNMSFSTLKKLYNLT